MSAVENIISDNLPIWSSSVQLKFSSGRGTSSKPKLYGVKKLRELILDLAVRGLLVPQDPNDESVSVLVNRISAAREQSINAGAIKKPKELPTITEEETIFNIPTTWTYHRLGEIATITRGITFPASEKSRILEDGRVACLRTSNVQDTIEWDDLLFIKKEYIKREDQYLLQGDIVISMANSRELVGKVAMVASPPASKSTFGGFLAVIRTKWLSPDFLMCQLRSPAIRQSLIESASQTTNIANISMGKLNPLVIGVPPLAEQHRIVAKVDELMALCDILEQQQEDSVQAHETLVEVLLEALTDAIDADTFQAASQRILENFDVLFTTQHSIEKLKETILQLAVMGKLVPQDPNDESASALIEKVVTERRHLIASGVIKKSRRLANQLENSSFNLPLPESWCWVSLAEIGHDWGQKVPDNEFTYIDVGAINKDRGLIQDYNILDPESAPSRARKLVKKDSVIYSTVRPYLLNIAVIQSDINPEPIVSTAFAVIHPLGGISSSYVSNYLRSNIFIQYVESCQTGIAYPAINDKQFFSGLIALPPLAEQYRIVAKVDELMALCDQLKESLQQAQQTQIDLADAVVENAL
jgi:type I restriction enzyme S subunit